MTPHRVDDRKWCAACKRIIGGNPMDHPLRIVQERYSIMIK